MSSHLWKVVYQTIRSVDRTVVRSGRRPCFADTLIVAMYLWSVWHDRPLCWAAQRTSYSSLFRPRRLPSRSQFCRRIKSPRCMALLRGVCARLAECDDHDDVRMTFLDGRALRVQSHSKDPDAKSGHAPGGFARGYKLHALAGKNGRFLGIRVTPLNVAEKRVAEELIEAHRPQGLLLADGNYDSGRLYDYAWERGGILMTPLRKNAGGGHRPQSSARMFAKKLWAYGGEPLYKLRKAIERYFGQLSAFGGGLSPLPAWVRRLDRVERWVLGKITIYHARLCIRTGAA